jgi:hypothetical protein
MELNVAVVCARLTVPLLLRPLSMPLQNASTFSMMSRSVSGSETPGWINYLNETAYES